MRRLPIIALLATACTHVGGLAPDDNKDTGTDDTTPTDTGAADTGQEDTGQTAVEECAVESVTLLSPDDGASPVGTNTTVQLSVEGTFGLDDVVIALASGDSEVQCEPTLDDGGVTITPLELLDEDTTYSWEVSICEVPAEGSFTTGSYGDPPDPDDLEAATFAINPADGTWVEPEGFADYLQDYLPEMYILLGVSEVNEESLDATMTMGDLADDGTISQDPCVTTTTYPDVDFQQAPYFTVGPQDMTMSYSGRDFTLHDTYLLAAFSGDANTLGDATLSKSVDTREFSDNICTILGYVGYDCKACSTDGEYKCIDIVVEDLEAARIEGLELEEIDVLPDECGR